MKRAALWVAFLVALAPGSAPAQLEEMHQTIFGMD